MPHVSPHARVEKTARLANDVRIEPFAYVGPDAKIAAGCIIESNATVTGRTTLGEETHVFPMAVVGASPSGCDEPGECIVGKANVIREHVTIYAGADKHTRIGNDNLIMISSSIAAGVTVGNHSIFANYTQIGEGAILEDYVSTSGFAAIGPNVRIGAYAFIAGYTTVERDVPPYAIVQGPPVRFRGVNTTKLRRCGFDDKDIRSLKEAFRELFNGPDKGNLTEVINRLLVGDINPHVRQLVEAIQRSHPDGGGADG